MAQLGHYQRGSIGPLCEGIADIQVASAELLVDLPMFEKAELGLVRRLRTSALLAAPAVNSPTIPERPKVVRSDSVSRMRQQKRLWPPHTRFTTQMTAFGLTRTLCKASVERHSPSLTHKRHWPSRFK